MAAVDIAQFYAAEFDEHAAVAAATRKACAEDFARLLAVAAEAIRGGHLILLFGNGGSAADAQHLAAELTVRYKTDRAPIPAIALTTDSSVLTATGNDFGFEHLFARQVEALGRPGDLAIGISTSGRSENVLNGLAAARERGMAAAGLSGGNGGKMKGLADPLVVVPSRTTARTQEMHILLGQMLCGALERELGLV